MPTLLRSRSARQRGVTLTELMIALVLGALVVLAATSMVVTSRGTYRSQDESTRLAESARFGLELSNRLLRLAGYTNFGNPNSGSSETPPAYYAPDTLVWAVTPDSYSLDGPNVVGSNNSKPGGAVGLNGSDSLTIRYFGSNDPVTGLADANVLDCAGTAVPEPKLPAATDIEPAYRQARAYNVLFVDADPDGEPALKCRRQTFDAAGVPSGLPGDTQTLIRGVEDFQVLYGEYIPQLAPNEDLDLHPPQSIVYRTGIGGPNPVAKWENVRSVRIAMLLRSATGTRSDPEPTTTTYALFGALYPAGATDTGTTFSLATLGVPDRTRVRRIVETTVFIRNRMSDWKSVQVN